jgi:hypothetical protein
MKKEPIGDLRLLFLRLIAEESDDAARLEERQAKARERKSKKKTRKQCPRFNRAGGATVRVERGAAA